MKVRYKCFYVATLILIDDNAFDADSAKSSRG